MLTWIRKNRFKASSRSCSSCVYRWVREGVRASLSYCSLALAEVPDSCVEDVSIHSPGASVCRRWKPSE